MKIYRYARAGNHLHLVVKITRREHFKNFLRAISGLIARFIMGAERSASKLSGEKFWDGRPFTRLAEWGKAFEQLCAYVDMNRLEALGFISYQPRKGKRRIFYE